MVNETSGWRGEFIAIAVVGVLVLAVVAAFAWKQSGQRAYETGKVIRFGAYADGFGDHPTVIVITSDGIKHQIDTTPELLTGCKAGADIKLIKSPTNVEVAPTGCR